ncbi:MAG: AAA family ATPase [Pseudomonadota bacterium]
MAVEYFVRFLEETWELWAALSLPVGTFLAGWRAGWWRTVKQLEGSPTETKRRLLSAEQKLIAIQKASVSEVMAWDKPRPHDAPLSTMGNGISKPVIMVANLKGGVGKTTISANVAAMIDRRFGQRVLAIDLDYQGSMTAMMMLAAEHSLPADDRNRVSYFLEGGHTSRGLRHLPIPLSPKLQRTKIVSAYHPLANLENRLLFSWLTGSENSDVRYHLASALRMMAEADLFDVCIIDAPPRMTTGFINAFCAATHILVPTILDSLSSEATVYFVEQSESLRQQVNPNLKMIGILPNFTRSNTGLTSDEESQVNYISNSIQPLIVGLGKSWLNVLCQGGRKFRSLQVRDLCIWMATRLKERFGTLLVLNC